MSDDRGTRAPSRLGHYPALLRHWRSRRGLSQLDLALAADVSARHISFLETGRSAPSAAMTLRLGIALDVPLRHINAMLRAAGHEPYFSEPASSEDTVAALPVAVRSALAVMGRHHDPYPMVVIDHSYRVLDLNAGAATLLGTVLPNAMAEDAADLNLARLTVDPRLGGQVIANHADVVKQLLWRMQAEVLATPDDGRLRAVLDELLASPGLPEDWRDLDPTAPSSPTLELQLRVGPNVWSFVVVVSELSAPLDVAVQELRVELWLPADDVAASGCAALMGDHASVTAAGPGGVRTVDAETPP